MEILGSVKYASVCNSHSLSACRTTSAAAIRLNTSMSVWGAFQDTRQYEACLSYQSCGQVLAELHGRKTLSCLSLTKYGVAVTVLKYRMIKKAEII